MSSLVLIEVRRIFTRRSVHALSAACLLAALAGTFGLAISEGRPSSRAEEEWMATRRAAEESLRTCMKSREQMEGRSAPAIEGSLPPEYRELHEAEWARVPSRRECFQNVNDIELERYVYLQDSMEPQKRPMGFILWAILTKGFRWLPYVGSAIGLLLGSTIGGADWSSGWVKTLLTWEARRLRLMLGKLLAVIVGMAALYLGLILLASIFLALMTAIVGTFAGFDSLILEDLLGSLWRGMAMTALGGVFGFSGAFALRYSLAGLVWIGGYFALEAAAWGIAPGSRPYSLNAGMYVFAVGFDTQAVNTMPPTRAAVVCGIAGLVAFVSAAIIFSRRDVTS